MALAMALAMAVAGATITDAALEVGFSVPTHFSIAVREIFGMAPTRVLVVTPIFAAGDGSG